MDKQKKEGNIKKEQPLPSNGERYGEDGGSARRWIEREIERERRWGTVGDGGGRWATVGKGGRQWGRRVGARESEKQMWRELELRFGGKANKPARLSTTTFKGLWSWKVPYSRPTYANVGRE